MERVAAGVRPISDGGAAGAPGVGGILLHKHFVSGPERRARCGAAVGGRAACWSGQTSAGRIITGRWGDRRDRLDVRRCFLLSLNMVHKLHFHVFKMAPRPNSPAWRYCFTTRGD